VSILRKFGILVGCMAVISSVVPCATAGEPVGDDEPLTDRPGPVTASGDVSEYEADKRVIDEIVPLPGSVERWIENLTPPSGWLFDTFKSGSHQGLRAYIVELDDGVIDSSVVPNEENKIGLRLDVVPAEHSATWPIRGKGNLKPTGGTSPGGPPPFASWIQVANKVNAEVTFINDTRDGDKVVSADLGEGAQGIKELKVRVNPAPTEEDPVILKIERMAGNEGSATFDGGEGDGTSLTLAGGGDVHAEGGEVYQLKILGGDTSSDARNMAINARNNIDSLLAKWEFTVFEIDLLSIVNGGSDQIPAAALSNGGAGPNTLRNVYNEAKIQDNNFGFDIIISGNQRFSEGGVYVRGKIIPAGVDAKDFADGRIEGINLTRAITTRLWPDEGCIYYAQGVDADVLSLEQRDRKSIIGRDETPGADINGDDHLYIHSIDVPRAVYSNWANQAQQGQTWAYRFNGTEFAEYARTRASNQAKWHYTTDVIKNADGSIGVNPNAAANDNEVAAGHVHMTRDLSEPDENGPTIAALIQPDPATVERPIEAFSVIDIEINGTNFPNEIGSCPFYLLLVNEAFGDTTTVVNKYLAINLVVNAEKTKLTGKWPIFPDTPSGEYKVHVVVGGYPAATAPQVIIVEEPE